MVKKYINSLKRMNELKAIPDSRIIVWGSQKEAEALKSMLSELSIPVSAYIDHSPGLNAMKKGSFFVACAFKNRNDYYEARFFMEKNGLAECYDFGDFSVNPDKRCYGDGYDFMDIPVDTLDLRHKYLKVAISRFKQGTNMPTISSDTLVVNAIDLKLTTKCTFSCKHCSAATPYINEHQVFDAEKIVNDLDKLMQVMYTPLVVVLGGEPLWHPEFGKVIKLLNNMKNLNHIGRFMLLSNATILPSIEALEDFRKLPMAEININDYGRSDQKIEEFEKLCKTAGVKYAINFEGKKVWYDFGEFSECRNYSDAQMKKLRYICDASAVIYNGRFYSCCRAAALEENGLLSQNENEFVDIRNSIDSISMKDELWSYLYEKPYLCACNYCNGSHIAAKQIPVGR